MSQSNKKPAGLVADANVLIDYAKSDKSVLALISRHVAKIHVPSPVYEEVGDLSQRDAVKFDISIVEPTLDQVIEAQAGDGPTSFQDRLCFVMARDTSWALLTNDKALRKISKIKTLNAFGVWKLWE